MILVIAVENKTELLGVISVHVLSSSGSVQHLEVHNKRDSVYECQVTELAKSSELGDWRILLVNYLKDPSQTRDDMEKLDKDFSSVDSLEKELLVIANLKTDQRKK